MDQMPANVPNTKKSKMESASASQDSSRMVQANAFVHSSRKSKMELAYVKQDSSKMVVLEIVSVRLTKNSLDHSVSVRLPLCVIMAPWLVFVCSIKKSSIMLVSAWLDSSQDQLEHVYAHSTNISRMESVFAIQPSYHLALIASAEIIKPLSMDLVLATLVSSRPQQMEQCPVHAHNINMLKMESVFVIPPSFHRAPNVSVVNSNPSLMDPALAMLVSSRLQQMAQYHVHAHHSNMSTATALAFAIWISSQTHKTQDPASAQTQMQRYQPMELATVNQPSYWNQSLSNVTAEFSKKSALMGLAYASLASFLTRIPITVCVLLDMLLLMAFVLPSIPLKLFVSVQPMSSMIRCSRNVFALKALLGIRPPICVFKVI
jgi:hypothetical protein